MCNDSIVFTGTAEQVQEFVAEKTKEHSLCALRARAKVLEATLRNCIFFDLTQSYFTSATHRANMLMLLQLVQQSESLSVAQATSYINEVVESLE